MPVAQPKAMTFVCPCCEETVRVPESYAGKTGRCPRCKEAIRLPAAGASKPSKKEKAPAKKAEEPAPVLASRRAVNTSNEGGSLESQMFSAGMVSGLLIMFVAVAWFALGWSAGRIYLYPPVMFICGLGAVIKAACEKPLPRREAVSA